MMADPLTEKERGALSEEELRYLAEFSVSPPLLFPDVERLLRSLAQARLAFEAEKRHSAQLVEITRETHEKLAAKVAAYRELAATPEALAEFVGAEKRWDAVWVGIEPCTEHQRLVAARAALRGGGVKDEQA